MQRQSQVFLFAFALLALTFSACTRAPQAHVLEAEQAALREALEEAHHEALEQASTLIAEHATPPDESELDLRGRFIEAVQQEDWPRAKELEAHWHAPFDDDEGQAAEIRLLLAEGDVLLARERAWNLIQDDRETHAQWIELWYQSFFEDENVWRATAQTLELHSDFDKLEALGGGSTVTLKVLLNDELVGVLKPHSTREQSFYRGEVAAYRLCLLMRCHFIVPQNTEVRVRVQDFLRAYGISSLDRRTGYSRNFSDLIVFEDDEGESWIHATFKAWVPDFTTYPLEHTDGWISLLNGATSFERLDEMTLADALRPMRGRERAYVPAMLSRAGDTDALDFARQLSSLHVFDYLLNNWDRYSGVFWGVNCQWADGHFVSIDNGAVLQKRGWGSAVTTRGRMRRIRMFSKETVDAIRAMDYDLTRKLLLPPNPHHDDEDERFDNFWERRNEFLEWIDDLIERRGEDRVLALP